MRNLLLSCLTVGTILGFSGCLDDLFKEPGYNCIGYDCMEVDDDADFSTYSSCISDCGSGGGGGGGGGGGNCTYTQYNGTQSCSSSGYSPVASGTCCPDTHPYHCSVTGTCFTTCEGAASACGSTAITRANLSGGGGGGGGTSGYDCVSGNCQYVSSGASYSSQTACESACGGGGGGGGGEDNAYAVTWQNSGGFWFAVGPVQSLWAGEETEEEALSYVIGSETTNYTYIGTCTSKFRVYDLNRDYNSYDLNTMDFVRENNGYTCNWP